VLGAVTGLLRGRRPASPPPPPPSARDRVAGMLERERDGA
jgi:hypothetical protein